MYIDGVFVKEDWPIAQMTTMRLGGPARYIAHIEKIEDIEPVYKFAKEKGLPIWVMGDGANTIGRDEGFNGVIFLNKLSGISAQTNGQDLRVFGETILSMDGIEPGEELILTGGGGWSGMIS